MTMNSDSAPQAELIAQSELRQTLIRRHLLVGWGGLFLFIVLGLVLDILLAYKVSIYVRADQEMFRLMWRLAHGHGTLLSLVHLGFCATIRTLHAPNFPQPAQVISRCLSAATVLIPLGFFCGGLGATGGDPGALVFLVPAGSVLLLSAIGWLYLRLLAQ